MKTRCRFHRLCSALCVGTILGLALCASAVAEPSGKNVVVLPKYQAVQKPKVIYYVKSSASAIPIPIERLGGIPTTTIPMDVIGDPRIGSH